ncbi:MAG TPA: ATPase [Clostridiaceae bacterium]|nr:ATPase [Clostridiaceae bacterium]
MEILSILETLEDVVERSITLPFSGKSLVDKEELLEIIKEIRLKLPDDIKQAKWITEERQRILLEAQKEASEYQKQAEEKLAALVDEHEITRKAYEQAEEIIANAQKGAREIRLGTKEYADEMLNNVEKILNDALNVIRMNRQELK